MRSGEFMSAVETTLDFDGRRARARCVRPSLGTQATEIRDLGFARRCGSASPRARHRRQLRRVPQRDFGLRSPLQSDP